MEIEWMAHTRHHRRVGVVEDAGDREESRLAECRRRGRLSPRPRALLTSEFFFFFALFFSARALHGATHGPQLDACRACACVIG